MVSQPCCLGDGAKGLRVYRPGIYPVNMKLDSKTASFYHSKPSEHLDGRQAIVPCANVLGGGSSINFMVSSVKY